jgi:PPOX class probable F420-dependent enzyme
MGIDFVRALGSSPGEAPVKIDTSTDFGARVERRLREETVTWLTTVRPNQSPDPSPVWFYWDGESFLIYSQPDTPKLRNIEQNPSVALNFNGDERGGNIIVINGEARVDPDAAPAHQVPEYAAKYDDDIRRLNMTPESFASLYSVAIRVTPTKLRGH